MTPSRMTTPLFSALMLRLVDMHPVVSGRGVGEVVSAEVSADRPFFSHHQSLEMGRPQMAESSMDSPPR